MQRDHSLVSTTPAPGDALAHPAAAVPSDQLWRAAIDAARQAADAAAELRRVLDATRRGRAQAPR